ncbi:MAG: hypothetical protein AAGG51_00585 [Cyanobacteria bacterium P01_G01_bin.54]
MTILKPLTPSLGRLPNAKQKFQHLVSVSRYTKLSQYRQRFNPAKIAQAANLPRYIERGGEQSFAPPYQIKNAELYLFALKANRQKLQALCDQYLNHPKSAFEYRPILGCVLLGFHGCESLIPAQTNLSFAQEGEVLFWIPVWKRLKSAAGQADAATQLSAPLMFTPYIFLNSSPALISGREALGYPKQWGWVDFPKGGKLEQGGDLKLETLVWQAENKPSDETVQGKRDELLSVSWASPWDWGQSWLDSNWRTLSSNLQWWSNALNPFFTHDAASVPPSPQPPSSTSKLFGTASGTVDAAIAAITTSLMEVMTSADWDSQYLGQTAQGKPCPKRLNTLIRSFCQHSFVNVFLKQFRDVRDAQNACYQAIVEAPCQSTKVHQIRLLKKHRLFKVKIKNTLSHPLVKELGLAPFDPNNAEQSYTVPARWLAWLNFDFKLEPGEIIWESKHHSRSGAREAYRHWYD